MSISLNASLEHIIPIFQARISIDAVKLSYSRTHAAIGHVLTSALNVVLCISFRSVSRINRSTVVIV